VWLQFDESAYLYDFLNLLNPSSCINPKHFILIFVGGFIKNAVKLGPLSYLKKKTTQKNPQKTKLAV
jgi:hypothetical protein